MELLREDFQVILTIVGGYLVKNELVRKEELIDTMVSNDIDDMNRLYELSKTIITDEEHVYIIDSVKQTRRNRKKYQW